MNTPMSWHAVLEAEFAALHGAPPAAGMTPGDDDERLRALHARILERGQSALCLSGGGIRSAAFGLGVLQGLACLGLLGSIDYLSTVSGGGYIGGWFTTWLRRQGAAGRATVLETINPVRTPDRDASDDGSPDEGSPVERVRRKCRYLALRGGVVSADVWTLVVTLARNLVLNWLVVLPLLAAALMVPRVYYAGVHAVEQGFTTGPCTVSGDAASWSFIVAILAFTVCSAYTVLNLVGMGSRWSQQRFLGCFMLPATAGAIAITFFWSAYPCQISLRNALLLTSIIPGAGWIVLGAVAPRIWKRRHENDGGSLRVRVGIRTVAAAMLAGLIMGAGAWWFGSFEYGFGPGESLRQLYAVFAVPLVMLLALAQLTVFIGLASKGLDDPVLEWCSRCGAWIAITAVVWTTAGVLVFYMSDVVEMAVQATSRALSMDRKMAAAAFGTLVPLLSSLAGLATRAAGQQARPSALRLLVQRVALPAVIFVLLSTVAWADLRAAEKLEYHRLNADTLCTPTTGVPCHVAGAGFGEDLILAIGLLAFGLLMSRFVPVNRFSLHGMYRQRLIRTFLGASRENRHPNAFTGFDANDDVCVHDLAGIRPLHVINTTLNAVSSTHMGRHETLAQSFTFTPLHVGCSDLGYRHASEYGSDGGGKATGLSLGTALAVSGAAASPEMGIYTTKSRAFLMTLANARLGLWFGNPGSETTWQNSEPPLGVGPLLRELLGLTTDQNPYVYLSDGGHFENLGLWEMVARRCRFVVVSDAGCDPEYTFADLANAVRRIRLDFGIPIVFPQLDLSRAGQGQGNPHAAIGQIRYSVVDGPDAHDGTILYIKATLSGDEPVDVRNFSAMDPTFPHDSTGNQFFDEARFESYRTLGFHSVLSVTDGLPGVDNVQALCDVARTTLAEGASPRVPQRT